MDSIREIIKAAGGAASVGRRVGKSRNAVWAWQDNGIPDWHWPAIMTMTGVTPQQLFEANQNCPNRAGKSKTETAA